MKENNLLVTLADKNYIEQAKQLFSSVYWNAGWKGDYMLLSHEIPEKDLKWFREKGILIYKCHPLEERKKIGPEKQSSSVLSKFYLFTTYFKKWKNIIYIDADTIVQHPLNKLSNLNGFWAADDSAGGENKLKHQMTKKNNKVYKILKKKFNLNKETFCSGIMAFSTNVIDKKSFQKLYSLYKDFVELTKKEDQLIFNLYFYRKWKKIPLVYNIMPMGFENLNIKEKSKKAIILHFIRRGKGERCWNKKNLFYNLWKMNLKKANSINLKEIPIKREIPNIKIKTDSLHFKIIYLYSKRKPRIEEFLGKIGNKIKKISPKAYLQLKSIENKIRK